jgi:hypothetical protein
MDDLQKRRLLLMMTAGILLVGGGWLALTAKREGGEAIIEIPEIIKDLPQMIPGVKGTQANDPVSVPKGNKTIAVKPDVAGTGVIPGSGPVPNAGTAPGQPPVSPGTPAPGATTTDKTAKGVPVLPATQSGGAEKPPVIGQAPAGPNVPAVGAGSVPGVPPGGKLPPLGIAGGAKIPAAPGANVPVSSTPQKGKPNLSTLADKGKPVPPNAVSLINDPKAPKVDNAYDSKIKEVDPDMDAVPEPTTAQTLSKKKIAAIVRYTAQSEAKTAAGRTDPFMPPVESYKAFPSERKLVNANVPPPPGSSTENKDQSLDDLLGGSKKKKSDKSKTKIASKKGKKGGLLDGISSSGLVPPPPPLDAPQSLPGSADAGSVDLAELPPPPSRPAISGKLKLISIIGDKAVLAFTDARSVHDNKWPKTITLGPGEQFESLSVADVNSDSVTIEEDGERTVKSLESIR